MLIDRIYQPVFTLGPGKRVVVWTQGCSKRCPGCANPELQPFDKHKDIPTKQLAEALLQVAEEAHVDRITLTGGDPLEQPHELAALLSSIRPVYQDVLIYTGFTLSELRHTMEESLLDSILSNTTMLIDGPYVARLNDGACPLRGSTNQTCTLLDASLKLDYDGYMQRPRRIQNVTFNGRSLSIGLHSAPLQGAETTDQGA